MTAKRIAYTRPDGGVSIIVPAPNYIAQLMRGGLSEDEAVAAVASSDTPADATDTAVCEAADIAADRTFRDAWTADLSASKSPVTVDMPKARAIHMNRIRAARTPEFARLDREWMKATGQKDTATAEQIEAERQALRDIPQTLDLTVAPTAAELKAIWPAGLPRT